MAKWISLALAVWFILCVIYWFGIGQTLMGVILVACLSAMIFAFFLLSSKYDLAGRVIIGMFGNLAVFSTSLVTHSSGYLIFDNVLAILFSFYVFSMRYERPYFIAFTTAPVLSAIFTSAFGNGRLVPLLVDQELATQVSAPVTLVFVLVGVLATLYSFFRLSEQREMELLFAAEKAKTEGEVRARFLANVTHEIRTPISSVLGLAGMLEEEEKNPSRQRMARNIVDVSNSILTIVNDLLDSAKLDAGKLEVNLRSEKVLDIFEGVFNTIRINAHSVNVSVYFDYDCDLPESIDTDAVRLRQILLNLLSNAIKFSKKSATGRKGEVHVLACRSSNDQLVIEVSDNGIGMSELQQSRLFKPFGQADATISQEFGGTGLGLSIAKALVEAMQGTISVRSRPNEGSTFKVQLPIRNPVFRTRDFQSPASPCLIYSTSAQFAGLVRRYLDVVGSKARHTHDLSEMMDLAAANEWPVILTDFDSEDVQDFAARLRQKYPQKKIIGMSSDPSVDLTNDVSDLIFEGPLNPGELWAALGINQEKVTTRRKRLQAAKHVLILEDDPVNRSVLIHQIQHLGAAADGAESGAEAMTLICQRDYDVILCDCTLPDTTGPDFSRKVLGYYRDAGKKPPNLFAVSGRSRDEAEEQCIAAGMSGFETKPVKLTRLAELIGVETHA